MNNMVTGKYKNNHKCETLLKSLRQIYILEDIFTYYTTKLYEQNILPRTKQIYILEN